ncbi:MAG: hypothetical protein AB7E79_14385 [Rhodospirillaceae bacterium]
MPIQRPPHIVCFAPYSTWSIHSAKQVAILQALRLRGCSVTYVTCDGVFSDCDVLQPANGAPARKPANACLICQSSVAARMAAWGMPYRWLSRWLSTKDFNDAAAWAHSLRPHDLPAAEYEGWPLGAWAASSVHKHLRHNILDFSNPQVAGVFASYLYGGRLAAVAFSRLIDEEKPDFLLLFNGRMAPMRTALELGRRRGIRTLVEERGMMPGHLTLLENRHCVDARDLVALWDRWKDVPLTGGEAQVLEKLFKERWRGQKDSIVFISGTQRTQETMTALGLDAARPIWVLFTSNLDEAGGTGLAGGVFDTHDAWVRATVDFAGRHPEIQLVIRVHPNSGSQRSFARNAQELAFYDSLAPTLPENVRLVRSDDKLNSYNLASVAAVGLTWHTTLGLEMAALGKPVVRCGSLEIGAQPCLLTPADPADYRNMLEDMARGRTPDPLTFARAAWRFGHLAYFRYSFPFPLVKQTDWYMGDLAFQGLDALAPGKDAMLDRICAHVMSGAALHEAPPPRGPDVAAAEAEHISRWIASAKEDLAA